MNVKLVMSIVFAPVMMFCATVCCAQSNIVYYGTNSNALDIVFVDTNLSAKVKSAIVADLNLCLSEWGKELSLDLDGSYETEDAPGIIGDLNRPSASPHYPNDIKFPRNIVSNGTAGVALQIPKYLSDAYTNAFALAKANAKAFATANAFVAFVSSTDFADILPNKLPDYLLCKNETPNEIAARAQEIISELGYQTYYQPSILGIKYAHVGPGEPTASNLWMRIPCSTSPYDNEKNWSSFPAIWHDGKWKFSLWVLE